MSFCLAAAARVPRCAGLTRSVEPASGFRRSSAPQRSPNRGVESSGKSAWIAERASSEAIPHRDATCPMHRDLVGGSPNEAPELLLRAGDAPIASSRPKKRESDPTAVHLADPRQDRNSHPERLAGRRGAVVGEGIKRNVDPVVRGEMVVLARQVREELDPRGVKPAGPQRREDAVTKDLRLELARLQHESRLQGSPRSPSPRSPRSRGST